MFHWNEKKRISNMEDHNLDFKDAGNVFNASSKITLESHRYGELRWMDKAEVDGNVFVLVYAYRGDTVWVISYRPASRKERRAYYGRLL